MRLLLDTTYLMPLIRARVREVPEAAVRKALKEHSIIISEVQIFELYAKGVKYLLQDGISVEDLMEGVEAAYYGLERIAIADRRVMESAAQIRRVLDDLVDAIILATALHYGEGIATLDERMEKAYEVSEVKAINPSLEIIKL